MDHKVRTRLDELKREELERLRHLATKEYNLMNNLDLEHLKIAEHLDHSNKHTFEIEDLKKLIAKVRQFLLSKWNMQINFLQNISFVNNIVQYYRRGKTWIKRMSRDMKSLSSMRCRRSLNKNKK